MSDKTRRASAATVDAITAILEGGDYYPHVPPTDKWHDENAGPIRAFAWPLLIQAGGLAQLSGARVAAHQGGTQGAFRAGGRDTANAVDEVGRHDHSR